MADGPANTSAGDTTNKSPTRGAPKSPRSTMAQCARNIGSLVSSVAVTLVTFVESTKTGADSSTMAA